MPTSGCRFFNDKDINATRMSIIDALDRVGPERAPDLGEHTDEILQELGFDPEAVAALRSKGGV